MREIKARIVEEVDQKKCKQAFVKSLPTSLCQGEEIEISLFDKEGFRGISR